MGKDIVVFDVEGCATGQNKITKFAALRISNGRIQESCQYLVRPEQDICFNETMPAAQQVEELNCVSSLLERRQEIIDLFEDSVLVCHNAKQSLANLEMNLRTTFQHTLWDTMQLARIFFPSIHDYQLAYLAEKLNMPRRDEAELQLADQNVWSVWKLLELCHNKGLELDLSFFDQAKNFLEGWSGRGFIDELHKEVARRFPDRPIRTDLVLAPISEGLFDRVQPPRVNSLASIDWVVKCFLPGGILEQSIPDYESRTGQVKMAQLIAEGLDSSHHVVVEAGTGTGKSFAYLIPCLWSAHKTGQKVVVATHTIPLQEQLLKKDIPILEDVLPFPFRASVLKGKSNYCCLKKWQSCLVHPQDISREDEKLAILSIMVWLRETQAGDIQELSKVPGLMQIWPMIGADNETCIPGRCPKAGLCFLLRARKKAEESDVLIVNHSLLFSDLKTEFKVLPEYHQLVVDEAHQIYETALQHLGSDLSLDNITRLLDSIYRPSGPSFYGTIKQRLVALMNSLPSVSWELFAKRLEDIPALSPAVLEQAEELFQLLSLILGTSRTLRFVAEHTGKTWWNGLIIQIENLIGRIRALVKALEGLVNVLDGEDADETEELKYYVSGFQRDLLLFVDTLKHVIDIKNPKQVTWLEQNLKLYLKTSPIEVSDILEEKIFRRLDTVILTSATLSISNSFEHFLRDIGLPRTTVTVRVDSPFDYDRQMRFFVVQDGIKHNNSEEEKARELTEFITEVAVRMDGRTLVLFTAHKLLRDTYTLLHRIWNALGLRHWPTGMVNAQDCSKPLKEILKVSF